jgi:hypothetical protein
MFDIRFDPERRILHLECHGWWTLGTLAAFSTAVLAKGTATRLRYGQFAVMNDVRHMPVQSAEVSTGLSMLMGKSAAITTAPFASVTSSSLAKLQAERVLKAPNTRVFLDWDQANAWLDAEWVQRRAA